MWWKLYKHGEAGPPAGSTPPVPAFLPDTLVRLVERPDKVRRVLHAEWHWERRLYV